MRKILPDRSQAFTPRGRLNGDTPFFAENGFSSRQAGLVVSQSSTRCVSEAAGQVDLAYASGYDGARGRRARLTSLTLRVMTARAVEESPARE